MEEEWFHWVQVSSPLGDSSGVHVGPASSKQSVLLLGVRENRATPSTPLQAEGWGPERRARVEKQSDEITGRSWDHRRRQKMKRKVGMTKGNRCQNMGAEQKKQSKERKPKVSVSRGEQKLQRETSQNQHCLGKKRASFSPPPPLRPRFC